MAQEQLSALVAEFSKFQSQQEACNEASLVLGESLGFWVQSFAIILTALFAAWAVYSSRQLTQRKNSADVIFNSKNDEKLRAGIKVICKLNNNPDIEISKYAYDLTNDTHMQDDATAINYVLNYYEYVAVGVKERIYDEAILKKSSYTTLVHMYEFCEPYIKNIRRQNQRPTVWCEFEALAKKWQNSPIHPPIKK